MLRLAPLLVLLVLLAGCGGGGQSESGKVTSVVRRYFAALAENNGSAACSLLSDTAKSRLRRNMSCPQLVAAANALLNSAARAAYRSVSVGPPSISGAGARVRADIGGRSQTVVLTKVSGAWRIDLVGVRSAVANQG